MTEFAVNAQARSRGRLGQWLFNPFRFVAGARALLLGLAVILISALLASLSNTHFDGVLDVHTGQEAPLWLFLAEGLIDWLCMAVVLLVFGFFVSRSSFRVIDIFGTQALARWPYLITAIALLLPGSQRYTQYLAWKFARIGSDVSCESTDVIFFVLAAIIVLLTLIWMVALMYRAYSVSCNLKGRKAIATFIAGIIIAEILSKALIFLPMAFLYKQGFIKQIQPCSISNLEHPFVNDPDVIGSWRSVDFVQNIEDFKPDTKKWTGSLYLKGLEFMPDGRTSGPWTWTKGSLWHPGDRTKARYIIKPMDGSTYMLMEWMSGDVTIRGQKPRYYVLKKQ